MLEDITKLVSLSKRRGFIFQSSEIYGGLSACYDYGPLGVLLKNNLKQLWWQEMLRRPEIEGLDTSILMSSKVWEASGHVSNFNDPMVDCRDCKSRFRLDDIDKEGICNKCGSNNMTEARPFNLMFDTHIGPVRDESSLIYLRPETAQGIYINFINVMQSTRQKLPFGIAQIGKAFRNEITARNFIFRMREFEQMEMQYFVSPEDDTDWFGYWLKERVNWYNRVLNVSELIEPVTTPDEDLAHYAKRATDIKFKFPFGLEEVEGVHHRGDYDLNRHTQFSKKDLTVFEEKSRKRVLPHVIETSIGVDRLFLLSLCAYYREDEMEGETRSYFAFPFGVAPYDVGVYPLMKKPPLVEVAQQVTEQLREDSAWVQMDVSGSIGKRYRRADEIGTPLGITIDFDTLEDKTVTVRDRDTAKQIRVPIEKLTRPFLKQIDKDFQKIR